MPQKPLHVRIKAESYEQVSNVCPLHFGSTGCWISNQVRNCEINATGRAPKKCPLRKGPATVELVELVEPK